MEIRGRVRNGVVVLEDGPLLPEGMAVTVLLPDIPPLEPSRESRRVELPLVPSRHPGSVLLTAERIAELPDEADFQSDSPSRG